MARRLEDLDDLEKLALILMSYSRLNTYSMCEAMYFFNYVVKEDQVFGAAAKLGNVLHSVLENTLEAGIVVEQDHLPQYKEEFKLQLSEQDPDSLIPEKLRDDGLEMIQQFLDRNEGTSFPIEAKEKAFQIVIGSAYIRGFIDRVDIEGDRVTITDYKSGRKEVSAKNAPQDLQLGLYALAMSLEYPDKEIYAQLYYLRSDRLKGHLFSRDDLVSVEERFLGLVQDVINKNTFHFTPNKNICGFCDFAREGVCSVGVKRNKYKSWQ